MHDIRTILVPLDFSDCSLGVVRSAAALASPLGARLVLHHAVEAPGGLGSKTLVTPSPGAEPVPVGQHLLASAEARMPVYLEAATAEGVSAEHRITEGRPLDTILQAADATGADMIVMGTHARTGLNRLLLGSVAEGVVRQAEIPVVTLRNIRHSGCEATSCASCRSHVTPAKLGAEAELDG